MFGLELALFAKQERNWERLMATVLFRGDRLFLLKVATAMVASRFRVANTYFKTRNFSC